MSHVQRTAEELSEQEERLTAVLNLLGFADIDTLEEYVCLHGGVSIVATRAPVEETQSQFPPSTQRRASKYQARKEELADSRHTAQILEREYEREKLELKRTLERANDEIYNKEVEVRKRVAAVEMLEGLQADFKELDDFALEKRQELNVAYDDLDAFDLALKEADTKALELQGEVLDLQRELEQERELRIAGEKSIVEKDIEIANLQQRLAQLTPAHTSSNTTLDSSTPRPPREPLFREPYDGPTPSRRVASPLRSSLTANRPPITTTSRSRPSSALHPFSNFDVVYADRVPRAPVAATTGPTTPSTAPAHSVHLECYPQLIFEVSTLNGKINKLQSFLETTMFKWLREQKVVYAAPAPTAGTQRSLPPPPTFLLPNEVRVFPILDDDLASDGRADELGRHFAEANAEVLRLRELYDQLKGWKVKAAKALQEVAAAKMAGMGSERVAKKGVDVVMEQELEKISPTKPRPTKLEILQITRQMLNLPPLTSSPLALSTISTPIISPRIPLSPRRNSIPPDGQPVASESLASEILPTPDLSQTGRTDWLLFQGKDDDSGIVKTPLAGTRWILPPPNPSLSRGRGTPSNRAAAKVTRDEVPTSSTEKNGPTCDEIELVDDGNIVMNELSSSQIPRDANPVSSLHPSQEPDTEPYNSQDFPPRPRAGIPQVLVPDTSSPGVVQVDELEMEPDTESLTFSSSPPPPQQQQSISKSSRADPEPFSRLGAAFPPPSQNIFPPPPPRGLSNSSSQASEQEFAQVTEHKRRQMEREAVLRKEAAQKIQEKARKMQEESESVTDEEEQRRADLEGFESDNQGRVSTLRRRGAKEAPSSKKGKEVSQKKGKRVREEDEEEPERSSKGNSNSKAKKARKSRGTDSDEEESEGDDGNTTKEMLRKIHEDRKAFNKSKQAAKPKPAQREIELNPKRNKGKSYHFQEVVRGKKERESMQAVACEDCEAYHQRAYGKSAPACDDGHQTKSRLDQSVQDNLQRISRHRVQYIPEPDPPDYWQLGFPSTAQVDRIHAQAAEINAAKRKQQEAEANKPNGLYRYKK